jgi:LysM repeat protein
MKKFAIVLIAALLIAGQMLTPAAAAALESGSCGDSYTVQHLDNLSKISSLCGVSLVDILYLNPQITNPNIIFTGQVLRLSGSIPTRNYSSTYTVESGDTLASIAGKYGITVWSIIKANSGLSYSTYLYTGMKLKIPANSTISSYAKVSLSDTSGEAGDDITVYVSGFPVGAYIDYRIGEENEDYVKVYDGFIDKDGEASLTFELPDEADRGEYWIVFVTTTSHKDGVEAYSHTIYIDD